VPPEAGGEAGARPAGEREPDPRQRLLRRRGEPGMRPGQPFDLLDERPGRAVGPLAAELADFQVEFDALPT
jgi:hypothetical protein